MTRTWSEVRAVVSVALLSVAAGGAPACARDESTSGETHFVDCERQSDCAAVGAGLACISGECQPVQGCPGGGVESTGYPLDPERGCVDSSLPAALGVACGGSLPGLPVCARRDSDGAIFVVDGGIPFEGFTPCRPDETELVTHSCAFDACEVPPASLCGREDTCATRPCAVDEYLPDGCRRRECSSDATCGDGERCVALSCGDASLCTYHGGECSCGGPAGCVARSVCHEVSAVGPQGDWQEIEVTSSCTNPDCVRRLTLHADGTFEYVFGEGGGTMRLGEDKLEPIGREIDGPELRPALRDGIACTAASDPGGMHLGLVLSTVTLGRDVSACAAAGSGSPIGRVLDLLTGWARTFHDAQCLAALVRADYVEPPIPPTSCVFTVPPLPDREMDPLLVNVQLSGMPPVTFGYAATAEECRDRTGWHLEGDTLTLCPAACQAFIEGWTPGRTLDVSFGCPRLPLP